LKQSAFQQYAMGAGFQQIAGACYLSRCAKKSETCHSVAYLKEWFRKLMV
jgi:hypothetical protein